MKKYVVRWVHEVTFHARDDHDAQTTWQDLDAGHLDSECKNMERPYVHHQIRRLLEVVEVGQSK